MTAFKELTRICDLGGLQLWLMINLVVSYHNILLGRLPTFCSAIGHSCLDSLTVGMIALSNSYLAQNLLGTMRFAAASRLVDHYMSLPYHILLC